MDVKALSSKETFKIFGYDGSEQEAVAVGSVLIPSNIDAELTLRINNVYVVPKSDARLLSMGYLHERGMDFAIDKGTLTASDKEVPVLTAAMKGRMFPIVMTSPTPPRALAARASTDVEEAKLWHERLGHLGYNNLLKMVQGDTVTGLPKSLTPAAVKTAASTHCETCVLAKLSRGSFPSTGHKASRPLEKISMDLCGPMPEPSLGGALYMATAIDDYSGMSFVAFTATKTDVKQKVKDMITTMELDAGYPVREIRTDRGTEYLNNKNKKTTTSSWRRGSAAKAFTTTLQLPTHQRKTALLSA